LREGEVIEEQDNAAPWSLVARTGEPKRAAKSSGVANTTCHRRAPPRHPPRCPSTALRRRTSTARQSAAL